MQPNPAPDIVVVGSLNIDHTLNVPRLPFPGETLTATGRTSGLGGKGANQALAAARAGARVALVGCVGADAHGEAYTAHLNAEDIDTHWTFRTNTSTGAAYILVDDAGENLIIVHPGANHALTPDHIRAASNVIASAKVLLLQLECPLAAVREAVALARGAGVHTLLNPSPLPAGAARDLPHVDTLLVNELEAARLCDIPKDDLPRAASLLLQRLPCAHLIITRGSRSTLSISASGVLESVPPAVLPVDTVGAGDAFAGAYAAAFGGGGMSMPEVLRFANAAGALATLKTGAQSAMPTRKDILTMLGMG